MALRSEPSTTVKKVVTGEAPRVGGLRQVRVEPRERRVEHQHGVGEGDVAHAGRQCPEPGRPAHRLFHEPQPDEEI